MVALILERSAQARITDAMRSRAVTRFCSRSDDIRAAVSAGGADLVVVECTDRDGCSTAPVIEQVLGGYPRLPVVVYAIPGRTPSADILGMARLGVHGLVMHGFDDTGVALRAALDAALESCAGTRVLAAMANSIPPLVAPFVRFCLDRAAHDPSVADAAAFLGVHRKTLVYRLRQADLPSPSAMIGWCRLFVAAHLLESPAVSVAGVALRRGFPSPSAFRGMLRRYSGLSPQELRGRGGLPHLLQVFQQLAARQVVARPLSANLECG